MAIQPTPFLLLNAHSRVFPFKYLTKINGKIKHQSFGKFERITVNCSNQWIGMSRPMPFFPLHITHLGPKSWWMMKMAFLSPRSALVRRSFTRHWCCMHTIDSWLDHTPCTFLVTSSCGAQYGVVCIGLSSTEYTSTLQILHDDVSR